jgi:hypothetical protein
MVNKNKLLLVEGAGDKSFFENLFKKLNINDINVDNIDIQTPKEYHTNNDDGKKGVRQSLVDIVKRFQDTTSDIRSLACIVDADYIHYDKNNDIQKTLDKIVSQTKQYGYVKHEPLPTGGFILPAPHKNFNPVGIWFMPNNHEQGMFEDWLLKIAKSDEKELLDYADTVCKKAPRIEFKQEYSTKAQVAVWTALQKSPHLGTENIILQNLYNENSSDFQNFITWLNFVFKI